MLHRFTSGPIEVASGKQEPLSKPGKRPVLLVLTLILIATLGQRVTAQEGELVEPTASFSIALELPEPDPNGFPVRRWPSAELDLGTYPSGKTQTFALTVLNKTDQDIVFRKVVTSCSCGKIKFDSNVIPAHSSIGATVRYSASKSLVTPYARIGIWLYGENDDTDDNPVARIKLSVSHSAVLAVKVASSHLEISEAGPFTFQFPVVTTAPVDPNKLVVIKSDEFAPLEAILDLNGSSPALVVRGLAENISEDGLQGEIILRDPGTKLGVSIVLTLSHRPVLTVTPRYLRLRESTAEEGAWSAMALLRVLPSTQTQVVPEIVRLTCTANGFPVSVHCSPIGNGVYRVDVQLTTPDMSKLVGKNVASKTDQVPVLWRIELEAEGDQTRLVEITTILGGLRE
jgi:Protein of unknown function (DUF1573)